LRTRTFCAVLLLSLFSVPLTARDKKDSVQYGVGLIVNVPSPESEVLKAVDEVVHNGLIRGTKEYNKDEYIGGATVANDSNAFPAWTESGKVFYKVRLHALDPRNFKNSSDVGTLTVRYVVIHQDDTHTVLKVDAIFVEDFRHAVHQSDGSVESAEYKDIHDHLDSLEALRQESLQAAKEKDEATQQRFEQVSSSAPEELTTSPAPAPAPNAPANTAAPADTATSSIHDLEQKVAELRKQTERRVKGPGAPLKSAPFHGASNLESMKTGAEVLIVISTPYWYGVETHDGQHGWMLRDDLEELP
jgi:polyhydroxyalkanoate synthesis regulator phasin